MVYQHFTVVPGMTVAENLLLARGRLPAVIDWKAVRAELEAFMHTTPFRLDLNVTPQDLSAGEKQKLEILKQLLLKPRLLILDEPTSVLTPQEADEVLGALRARAHAGACSIVLITHKFREVVEHADDVSVLRRGRLVTSSAVQDTSTSALAQAMVGDAREVFSPPARAAGNPGATRLEVESLEATGDRGEPAIRQLSLAVRAGEILGVAGVSGNGQRELVEVLTGQRPPLAGRILVSGQPFHATRAENHRLRVRCLPEEPMRNACIGELSVAHNMALRQFDRRPFARAGWIDWARLQRQAREWIAEFGIRTQSERAAISTLSGGNVQRAVLARELSEQADLLIVSNPVFGLDFAAVTEIHARLIQARDRGTAVLLISEDLDELLQLADRIVVISEGRIVHEVAAAAASRQEIGAYMGGRASQAVPAADLALEHAA